MCQLNAGRRYWVASCGFARAAGVLVGLVVLAHGLSVAVLFAADRGVQVTPDGKRVLVSKDVGAERWAISLNDDGTVTGNVFLADGGDPLFVWCEEVSRAAGEVTLRCSGADQCSCAPCPPAEWSFIADVTLPESFFLPEDAATQTTDAPAIMVPERQSGGSGLQFTLDRQRTLINKDVGNERWAITLNEDDRTATGNVFFPGGGDPKFIWCRETEDTGNTVLLECLGADRCAVGPCSPDDWTHIADVALPLAFFQSSCGLTIGGPPVPDPCEGVADCYSALVAGALVTSTGSSAQGFAVAIESQPATRYELAWAREDGGAIVVLRSPDGTELRSRPFEQMPGDPVEAAAASFLIVRDYQAATGVAAAFTGENADNVGNHAGCDVLDFIDPRLGLPFSCRGFGGCCDEHDACIAEKCRGSNDSGHLTECFFPFRTPDRVCLPTCVECHEKVAKCFHTAWSRPIRRQNSECCRRNDCDQLQQCMIDCVVITDPCTCDASGIESPDSCTSSCGNGTVDGNDQCDATDLDGQTCASLGFDSGTLSCSASCQFDTDGCDADVAPCTPGPPQFQICEELWVVQGMVAPRDAGDLVECPPVSFTKAERVFRAPSNFCGPLPCTDVCNRTSAGTSSSTLIFGNVGDTSACIIYALAQVGPRVLSLTLQGSVQGNVISATVIDGLIDGICAASGSVTITIREGF